MKGFLPIIYLHASDIDSAFEPIRWNEMRELIYTKRLWWMLRQKQWSIGTRPLGQKLREILKIFPNIGPLCKFI